MKKMIIGMIAAMMFVGTTSGSATTIKNNNAIHGTVVVTTTTTSHCTNMATPPHIKPSACTCKTCKKINKHKKSIKPTKNCHCRNCQILNHQAHGNNPAHNHWNQHSGNPGNHGYTQAPNGPKPNGPKPNTEPRPNGTAPHKQHK